MLSAFYWNGRPLKKQQLKLIEYKILEKQAILCERAVFFHNKVKINF